MPSADSHSQRRADLVTCRGGLVRPNPRPNFGPSTLLVMDFELVHTFTSSHHFKPLNIANMELQKRSKYLSVYHDAGLAFAPLVSNSLGQFGPDLLRFLWGLADRMMLRATRSRLSFKIFPISTLIPRLQHRLLSNVCAVLSMCRPHTGSWLLF